MYFKDLELKPSYDSDEDNVLLDFYIPVLSRAKKYNRLAGYFSSSILVLASEGIAPFISNQGSMKLIVGAVLSENDVNSITEGLKTPQQIVSDNIIQDLEQIKNTLVTDHLKALSWMVSQGYLEIKIAIPLDSNNLPISSNIIQKGIFHQKVGILEDHDGNSLSFSGSINETANGWVNNVEEFKVFREWVAGERPHFKSDQNKFIKYYDSRAKNTLIFSIPEAVKNKLIQYAPKEWDRNTLEQYYGSLEPIQSFEKKNLWPHQKKAIDAWVKNDHKGILAMATGSGKTFTALASTKLASPIKIVIITVPTRPLLYQWIDEISQFDQKSIIIACSGDHDWKDLLPLHLAKYRRNLDYSSNKKVFVVSTIHTASSERFRLAFRGIDKQSIQIISDEVHHLGAPMFQKCMDITSSRRMGLSATPERQWDLEGTMKIIDYFGPTIYEYDIGSAIEDGYLSHYKYYPHFAYLDPIEFEDYINYTNQINRIIAIINSKSKGKLVEGIKITNKSKNLEQLLRERAKIKKKAVDKIRVLHNILNNIDSSPILVFCEDNEQLNEVKEILHGKKYLMYTSKMNPWEQKETLKIFKEGKVDILLAIKCLDEGLDVPDCEGSIILASSSSTREFVQRRGRILRSKSKKIAVMHDIIVLPSSIEGASEETVAKQLIQTELSRMKQLIDAADNEWETRNIIRKELSKVDLEHLSVM